MTMTAVSLFSGIGGFELGLARAGVRTVASVEIDDPARGVIADRFPNTRLFTDIRKVTGDQLVAAGFDPRNGIVTAGWPCQGNSVAGRRGGMDDPRSGLWREVVRVLAELRPAWFFGENVPGLLQVNGGRDFATVVGDLAQLRMGVCWRVLDSQYFGVPQRRSRVFVVGHFGNDEYGPVKVLLEPESGGRDSAPVRPTGAGDSEVAAVSIGGGSGGGVVAPLLAHQGRNDPATETFLSVTGDRTHALTAEGHDASEDGTGRGTPIVGCGTVVRRLTPLEKERLQGFPDGWTSHSAGKIQSDSARAKQLGNSVAVPVIEWIGRRLVKVHETAAHPVTHAH